MPGPFDDEGRSSQQSKVELKKPQTKSMFDNKPKLPSAEEAKKQASVVNDQINSYNARALEATTAFMKLIDDHTIPSNKSVFAADVEREVIGKLQQLALDIEADDLQPNGMGPVGVVSFLLKVVLVQREKINQLDYNINLLDKKLKEVIARTIDIKPNEK